MVTKFYRAYAEPTPKIVKEFSNGRVELTDEEVAEGDNVSINFNCTCGFPLYIDLKKHGQMVVNPNEDLNVKCFLCKKDYGFSSINSDKTTIKLE